MNTESKLIIYTSDDGLINVDVTFDDDTVCGTAFKEAGFLATKKSFTDSFC